MTIEQNPYTPMLLSYNPDWFYGRAREITTILQIISAVDPNSYALYGIRTIGKTTLLKYLKDPNGALRNYEQYLQADFRRNGTKRLLFVYVNFHTYDYSVSIFYIMLEELKDEIADDDTLDEVYIPSVDSSAGWDAAFEALRDAINNLAELSVRVVYLMDDFDRAVERISAKEDGQLRTLNEKVCLIIATEKPITEIRPSLTIASPLLGILKPEPVQLLDDTPARQLFREPMSIIQTDISAEEEDLMLDIAGRQPFMLIAACELYFDVYRSTPQVMQLLSQSEERTQRIHQFIVRLLEMPHIDTILSLTWQKLQPDERNTLFILADDNKLEPFSREATLAARLANKALVYWHQSMSYRLYSQLFKTYITRLKDQRDQLSGEPIAERHPINGNGHGGSHVVLSVPENLTPIDQALLQYFIEHVGKVCTFDELLDAVWEDSEKSKRALEASVFRLRKTLTNGSQIKNIRGRGYKFLTAERV